MLPSDLLLQAGLAPCLQVSPVVSSSFVLQNVKEHFRQTLEQRTILLPYTMQDTPAALAHEVCGCAGLQHAAAPAPRLTSWRRCAIRQASQATLACDLQASPLGSRTSGHPEACVPETWAAHHLLSPVTCRFKMCSHLRQASCWGLLWRPCQGHHETACLHSRSRYHINTMVMRQSGAACHVHTHKSSDGLQTSPVAYIPDTIIGLARKMQTVLLKACYELPLLAAVL